MGQSADELKTALKNAAKAAAAKPHFFAMVIKGGAEGTLIVDKRKIQSKAIDAAKKEFNTGTVVKGVVFGDADTLVFETAKPPAGNFGSMAKRMAQVHAGLSIKPEFKQGRDDEQVGDDDGGDAPQAQPQPQPDPQSPAALAKKAYELLLDRLLPEIRTARESGSPKMGKVGSLLEFAATKAAAGEHRTAIQALQTVQTVLEEAETTDKAEKAEKTEKTEKTEKAPVGKPSTTARARAPIEQDQARGFLAKVDPEEAEDVVVSATADLLDDMKKALTAGKKMVTVDDVDALADAMARENGMSVPAAKEMIANNQGRGFTGKSGTVYVLGNTSEARHDEVHETVHLMSAPGGATQVMAKYGEQLNEALTEFFTKQMCAKLNVPDAVAYPEHVAFMKKLAPVVGYHMLYTAYMKNGGFDPVINKLTDIWIGKAATLPTPQKPPNTKGVIDRAKVVEAMDKKFLNNFPPPSSAMKFWDTVFFS